MIMSSKKSHVVRALLFGCVASILSVVACAAGWDDVNPASTAASKDYPCGPAGQVCDVMPRWQDDTCCAQNDVCPGPHAGDCTPGECCFGAAFDPSPQYGGARRDGGAPLRVRAPVRRAQ